MNDDLESIKHFADSVIAQTATPPAPENDDEDKLSQHDALGWDRAA